MTEFKDRRDTLSSDWRHGLQPHHLEESSDPVLQEIVSEAASLSDAPIAIVSLLMNHIQLFRAHVGLPEDLATSRATDRDASFCQFVVRDASVLAIEDAKDNPDLPQDLVNRYGIRSYLGAPVVVDGVATGSVCILDIHPREFSEEDHRRLRALAARASAHLEGKSQGRSLERTLRAESLGPAFGEIRNALMALVTNAHMAQLALTELRPVTRLSQLGRSVTDALAVLRSANHAYDDLASSLDLLTEDIGRISRCLVAIEASSAVQHTESSLEGAFCSARELVLHHTRLAPSVSWPEIVPDARLTCSPYIAINSMVTALSHMAKVASGPESRRPLKVALQHEGHWVHLRLTVEGASDAALKEALAATRPWMSSESQSSANCTHDTLELTFRCLS